MYEPEASETGNQISELSILPQIENVVYVMFENRSLDNFLGWLYAEDSPKNIYPCLPRLIKPTAVPPSCPLNNQPNQPEIFNRT